MVEPPAASEPGGRSTSPSPSAAATPGIVETARREGLAGATVLRGIEGFGASSHLHTSRILRLSKDLPVVIEIVDSEENIDRVLPMLDGMVGDGMMTIEKVHIVTYRGSSREG